MYKFDMKHVPGSNKGPDTTLWYPAYRVSDQTSMEDMEAVYSSTVLRRWQTSEFKAVRWEDMIERAVTDELVTHLNEMILAGFQEK